MPGTERWLRFARRVAIAGLILGTLAWFDHRGFGRRFWYPAVARMAPRSVADVLAQVGPRCRAVWAPLLRDAGLPTPPAALRLVAFKRERRLEVWAGAPGAWHHLRDYEVLAASGGPGPKLREGDLQVPEGIYRLTHLNPMSSYHLSIRVDYPNQFDRAQAASEGRSGLGGDIYIHGRSVSIGCLAIGDTTIEELFTLVADVGLRNSRIVIAPGEDLAVAAGAPAWTGRLYQDIARELHGIRTQ